MPPSLISISAFICDRVLCEQDHVFSAIRIVDVFFCPPLIPNVPPERQVIGIAIVILGKFLPGTDSSHRVQLQLLRPDGDITTIGEETVVKVTSSVAAAAGGFTMCGPVGVIPTQMGLHYLQVLLDGEEATRTPFTLVPQTAVETQ
ncbi:MAG TPA: hypothetical protein VKV15_18235 [Bryobacteraceae bacterium]|nr:hypothetical protein [Bryobacteraceae bacterium]